MSSDAARRVLHLIDRSEGGVPNAVADYITNSPDGFEHTVLAPAGEYPRKLVDSGARVQYYSPGLIATSKAIHAGIRTLQPHVVHAHSSFPGLRARLLIGSGYKLVYSPHCFAFLRTDVGRFRRWVFLAAERLLAARTDVIAACGGGELQIATRLMRRSSGKSALLPNVSVLAGTHNPSWNGRDPIRMGMSGRISRQKDPDGFVRIVRDLTHSSVAVDPVWIGDGDARQRDALIAAGVEVTGWSKSPDALSLLMCDLDLYVHSAAWEGFPLSVLDAARVGLPILVRGIGAFDGIPEDLTVEGGLSGLVTATRCSKSWITWAHSNRSAWGEYLNAHRTEFQRASLKQIWGA